MEMLGGALAWLRAVLFARNADRELEAEIRFHIEQETEHNIRRGYAPDEARRKALADFGGALRTREEHHDVRGVTRVEEIVKDVRFALRTLRRAPAVTAAAIVTLALGIGATTAIFSVVNAVVIRPLPFPDPDRLVMLWEENPDKGWYMETAAPANALDWREQVPGFQDVAMYNDVEGSSTLSGGGGPPLIVKNAQVSGNFFALLGARAALGRTFTDRETWSTGTPITILSHRLWTTRFRGDSGIVGRSIELDGQQVQVVGVMPASFAFPTEGTELWSPLSLDPAARGQAWFRRAHWMRVIARLAPGVSFERAEAQLEQVVRRLQVQYPETNTRMGAGMTSLHEFLIGSTRRPLLVLLGAVTLLLLIACANIGNLLLVQASGREREFAVRLAIGAGRGRLVRQALTESLVLSVAGSAAGLFVGWAGTRLLLAIQPEDMLRVSRVPVDGMVLLFVTGVTAACGLLFGIAPAVWSGRRPPADALRNGARGSQGARLRRWGDALAIGEVALSLLLLAGAGLLVRSFLQLRNVDAGFDARGVLTARVDLPRGKYDTGEKTTVMQEELLRRVRALPTVSSAALVGPLPLTRAGWTSDVISEGRSVGDHAVEIVHRRVSPGYFRAMRVPLRRGRDFEWNDRRHQEPVAIINEAFASSYFRGSDPVGKRITFDRVPDSTSRWYRIVGVVGNEHQETLALAARPEVFATAMQDYSNYLTLVARTSGDPAALAPAVRRVLDELDPSIPLASVRSMEGVRAESLAKERFMMTLLLVFAGVGLVLAVVGVYGVLAQIARRRTREMGIRIALGAQAGDVRRMIVLYGLRLAGAGLVIGGLSAVVATRALRGLLFRVPAADPVTLVVVALVLAMTSVVAAWLPALRASRADPVAALRAE